MNIKIQLMEENEKAFNAINRDWPWPSKKEVQERIEKELERCESSANYIITMNGGPVLDRLKIRHKAITKIVDEDK